MTLKDVAGVSGVSITTVSRVLNGRETGIPIRDETRQRILAAAADLGYTPNLLARGLRGSRSSLLGVIARDVTDPFHTQVLSGINEVARARDYRVFLGHVDYRPDAAVAYGSMLERSHADGIIMIGDLEGGEPALEELSHQHRYVVGVTDRTERRRVPGVYADSRVGSQLAMEHLWELGHRSIVCVSDDRTNDGRLRSLLYEQFMRDRGAGDQVAVHITDQEPEPSYQVGRVLFAAEREALPTAIFATSDTIAIGLMRAAFEAGITVPERHLAGRLRRHRHGGLHDPATDHDQPVRCRDGQGGGRAARAHGRGGQGHRRHRRHGDDPAAGGQAVDQADLTR